MHNMGHVFLSYIHDPDHRHLVRGKNDLNVFSCNYDRYVFVDGHFKISVSKLNVYEKLLLVEILHSKTAGN